MHIKNKKLSALEFSHFTYLGSASDHVLDEISVSRSIYDGDIVLAGFKFPQGNINCDTTLTLSLQFVQNPGILEGTFAHLGD